MEAKLKFIKRIPYYFNKKRIILYAADAVFSGEMRGEKTKKEEFRKS